MRVAVTGGTGFLGGRLLPMLQDEGHEVVCFVRDQQRARMRVPDGVTLVPYDAFDLESVGSAFRGGAPGGLFEAVINLAGESVAGLRWTKRGKARIRESRVVTTRILVDAMKSLETLPSVLLSGSAVGFYGPRGADDPCVEGEFDASQFAARDFLSHVCREWEAAARGAERLGMRVVRLRLGVVLGKGGGALAEMELPFKLGAGGPIGSGKQVMSWIHIEDVARMIVWSLRHETLHGPLNVTAPNPVTNREFSSALGESLHRPAFLPVPVFALRVLKGKVAGMLATGQRVLPTRALEAGFTFRYPTLREALAAIYTRAVAA